MRGNCRVTAHSSLVPGTTRNKSFRLLEILSKIAEIPNLNPKKPPTIEKIAKNPTTIITPHSPRSFLPVSVGSLTPAFIS